MDYRKATIEDLDVLVTTRVDMVILQSRSPSCGAKQVYDGSFSGRLIEGRGVFAQLLVDNGIKVLDLL